MMDHTAEDVTRSGLNLRHTQPVRRRQLQRRSVKPCNVQSGFSSMKTYITVALLLVALPTIVALHSPRVSSDSAFGYLPLEIGNIWEYDYRSLPSNNHLYYYTETITGDTVAPNGTKYFVIYRKILPDSSTVVYLERVDSATANVYTYHAMSFPTETPQDSLRSKPGDTFATYFTCTGQHTQTVLGVQTTVKSFRMMD